MNATATDDPTVDATDPTTQQKKPTPATSAVPGAPISVANVPPIAPVSPTPTQQPLALSAIPPNPGGPPAGAGASAASIAPTPVPVVPPSNPLANPFDPANPNNNSTIAGPTAGMTEQQKAEYWGSQPGVSAMAASTRNPDGTLVNDPTKQAALVAGGQADPAVSSLLSTLQSGGNVNAPATAQASAASGAYDTAQAVVDAANNAASARAASAGFYKDPANANATSLPGQYYTPGSEAGVNTINGVQSTSTTPGDPTVRTTTAPPGQDAGGNPLPNGPATAPANPLNTATSGTPTGSATAPIVNTAAQLTPTDPSNPLTAQTISADPTVNRFAVANQQLQDTIKNTLDPAEAADSRTIAANSFGAGRGVSGMNRTAEGNLESDYNNQRNQLASSFLNPALTGTIADQQFNVGQADQQQAFEKSQQDTNFGQNVTTQQLGDQLTNSAANRAAQQEAVGEANSPSQVQLILSQISAGGAQQAGSAAANALKNAGIDSSKMTPQQAVQAYLSSLGYA